MFGMDAAEVAVSLTYVRTQTGDDSVSVKTVSPGETMAPRSRARVENDAVAGGDQLAVGQPALGLDDRRFLACNCAIGRVDVFLPRADLRQASASWAVLQPGLGFVECRPGVVMVLERYRPLFHQSLPAFERKAAIVADGLPLCDRCLCLGNLFRSRAMLQPIQRRFQVVAPGTGQPQLIIEIPLVQSRRNTCPGFTGSPSSTLSVSIRPSTLNARLTCRTSTLP